MLPHIQSALEHLTGISQWVAGSMLGSVVGIVYGLAQGEGVIPTTPVWYTQPAVVAAFVAGVFMITVNSIGWVKEWRKGKHENEKKEDDERIDLRKLTDEKWLEMVQRADVLSQREKEFLQTELVQREIDVYRQREISHAAFNALNKSYGHIRKLERLVFACGGELPEFEWTYQEDILRIVEPKVADYKRQIRNNYRAVSGAPDNEMEKTDA